MTKKIYLTTRISFEEMSERIFNTHGKNITMSNYIMAREYADFHCNICGYDWRAIADSVSRGNGCQMCGRERTAIASRYSIEQIREFIEKENCHLISNEYINNKEKILIQFECGHIGEITYDDFRNGNRCSQCRELRMRQTIGEKTRKKVLESLKNNNLEFISSDEDIMNWDGFITYKCEKNHIVRQNVRSFMRNKCCSQCSQEISESPIATLVKKYCKEKFGKKDSISEYKVIINPKTNMWLRSDVYIKSINLYIEVNGHQHYEWRNKYHRTYDDFIDQRYRDNLKKRYILENGNYLEIDLRNINDKMDAIKIIDNCIINLN